MGSIKIAKELVIVACMMFLLVLLVDGNYSIACGGSKAVVDELSGNTDRAKERGEQAAQELKEVINGRTEQAQNVICKATHCAKDMAQSWSNWAMEKIQHGLGLKHEDIDGVGDCDATEKIQTTKDNEAAHVADKGSEMAGENGKDKLESNQRDEL